MIASTNSRALCRTAAASATDGLIGLAWIHPCILCELNYLADEWLQRLVEFNCLFAQLPQIVRLGKRLIMPHQEPLQCAQIDLAAEQSAPEDALYHCQQASEKASAADTAF